ncbi:UNVERIFIED_CONTAM: hypothetical protein FKN15_057040 [Acipenser sinensis]
MGVTRVTEGLLAVLAVFMHTAICNGSPEKGYSPLSFTHHLYNATIYENTAPKTYIESSIKMGIYITDPLWSIKYKLVSGDDDSLFKIEDYTVGDFSFLRIRTRSGNTASLNREVRDSYTLTIQSSESTYEYEARTKVVIRVLDANDLKPLFSPASYSVTVGEDTPLKSSVVKVRATDADLGSNAQFYYSFTRRYQTFVVNPSTGEIALAKKLNHTQASKYELVVLAEDRVKKIAGIRGYGNVARVVVNVEKVTPLPPVIKSVEVTTPGEDRDLLYATVITEAGRQGLQVDSVAIVAGDPLNYFKVMPSPLQSQVYQVVTAKKVNWLSYPFGFNLSLQAKDKSNPPLSSLIKNIHIPSPKSAVLKFEKEVYHDNSKFKINPRSGLIVTTENMDYEKKSQFELDVMTSHGEAKARVVVDIIDENDNAPKFSQSSYKGTVSENEPIGTSILRVTAVDSDRGENGFITYAIANRGPLPFTIHPFTGVISTSEKLDYEMMQRWYHLRIWASDSGLPFSHVTESSVSIIMNNVNDNIPMFEKVGCNVTIPQSLSPGDRFGIMSAVDLDELQQVRYEIVSGNELGLFELNSVSGMLLLKKSIPLAYPADVMPLYILKITATDGENYAQPTDINITVIDNNEPASMNCEDTGVFKKLAEKLIQSIKPKLPLQEEDTFSDIHIINHHSPKFDAALPRSLDIKEDTAVNSTILQFKASDQDSGFNGKLVYVIFDGSEDGTFIVDMDTGDLKVHAPLDRETTGFYILNITVYDLGTPQKSSWKLLAVNIIDANDNPPRFDQSSYFLTVPEDAAVETSIFQVKATDIDLEDNGRVQYSFLTSTDRFSINELTGVVRVTRPLDRETCPTYKLKIEARDQASADPQLFSTADLLVAVQDVNDNPPSFVPKIYKIQVPEDLPIGTLVLWVEGIDPDLGPAGEIIYNLVNNENRAFQLETSTGALSVEKELDFEQKPFYNLTVRAVDHGRPQALSSSCYVEVEVLDVNENLHTPRFSSFVFKGAVSEDASVGTSVIALTALDEDSGRDGEVRYFIKDGSGLGVFSIEAETGVISSTALLLDREEREEHILEVVVDDNGSPPLQSTATVVIQVLDVNDQTPLFTHKLSTVRLLERHGVTEPEALYRMIAQDQDQGSNAEITYSLEEDSEKAKFTIHPGSGTVWSRSDFSPGEYSILTIKATDGGSPAKSSTARLHIEWVPKPAPSSEPLAFDEPHFNFAVMETDPVTHMVGIISTDISQSLLWFDITGGDSEQEFDIEKNSGSIVIARPLNAGRRSNYNLTVRATDGTKAIKTQAYIRVVDINEHRPQFLKSHYEMRVPEDTPPWKEILQMSATDMDGSSRLVYTIHSSVDPASLKHFQLNPSSGTLVTTATLDYETLSVHTLTVMVRDQEVPVKRNFVKVIVYVEDCNDHPPSFMSSRYEGSVLNLAAVGTEVVQVKAMDKDKGNNAEMIYTFHSGNTESAFSIDPESGKITVAKPLDQLPQERYHLTVKATDQGFPQLSDLTTVNIQVKLSDYTPPKFSMMEYFAEISEAAHVGSPVITLTATSPTTVSYEIKDGNPNGTFQVNYYSGVLTVQKPLDFENVFSYRLRVRAANLAGSFAEAVVFVYVIDENDNAPAFLQSEFTGQISESVHLNSMVMGKKNTPLVIKATDADKESNALLVYKILEPEAQKYFRIEPSTGTLATAASIDFEVIPVFHFTVQVHDSGTPSLYADKPARVTVHVLNVNDCPPKFAEHLYESSLCLPAFFGMEVIKVTAVDADSDVTYSINEGNLHSAFTINPTTGLVSVNNASNLSPNYQLTVKASDGLYKDTALVKINVTDITTSGLGFEQKAYTASVLENSTAIQTLAVVRATGNYLNEPLFYLVLNPAGMFWIVQTSGVLQTTGVPFDREQKDLYDVVVQVRDTRRPPRVAHTHVKVYIEDINDNAPEFVNLPYSMAVQDDAEPGDVLFQVTAVDKDLGDNKAVIYSLADDFAFFRIDPYLGDVSLRRPFDFETLNAYELVVIAADRGDPPLISEAELVITVRNKSNPIFQSLHYGLKVPENISPYTALLHIQARNPEGFRVIYNLVEENASRTFNIDFKSGILSVTDFLDYETQTQHVLTVRATDAVMGTFSEATVEIEVEDINDNPPLFQKTVYTAEVFEGLPIGTSVLQVHASDKDSGRNKAISYEINSSEFFDIDALSGQIVTTQELDYETIHQFHLKVKALDNGVPPMTSEALVIVNVSDVNDNPPEFTQPQYEATLSEMATCGQIVIKVQASDPDVVDANNLEYVIFSGNDDRHFAINKTSGIISFSNVCKRSLDPFYNLTVSVSDGVFKKSAPVNIDMMTANKHSPYFDQSIYEAELAENAEVGTQVIRLAAIDPDAGPYGSVDYTIINMLAEEKFSIDNKGQIVTSHTLDRENPTERVIAIKVMAKDGGGKVAFCTVKIILTDENDNAPQFKASEYHVSIQSNVSKGSPVIQIMAYDADEGTNADVTYFVDEAEEVTEEIIEINPFTGVVTIKESLVGLENKIFNFKVKARDGGSPHYNTSVPVQVQVVPSEVPLPRFSEPLYTFSAAEDLPTGSEIGSVRADANEPVIYSLVEGNTVESNKERVFALDKESGALVVQKNIDHEKTKWYQVDVMAHCNHNGTDVASLVSVLYTETVSEDAPAGFFILKVSAKDPDHGTNGQVTYTLHGPGADKFRLETQTGINSEVMYSLIDSAGDYFSVDEFSGILRLEKTLSDEPQSTFELKVKANDLGLPRYLTSVATVTVNVVDLSDYLPVFLHSEYTTAIPEGSALGVEVLSVSALTRDGAQNVVILYDIISGNEHGKFSIDSKTGKCSEMEIIPLLHCPTEPAQHSSLVVFPLLSPSPAACTCVDDAVLRGAVFELRMVNPEGIVVFLFVFLLPVILNTTEMQQRADYMVSLNVLLSAEGSPVGSSVLRLMVTDRDTPPNGPPFSFRITAGDSGKEFQIDSEGLLTSVAILRRRTKEEYLLQVQVTDSGYPPLSSSTFIKISIIEQSQYPPSAVPLEIFITTANEVFSGRVLGKIHATDQDLHDVLSYKLLSESPPSHSFTVSAADGKIIARDLLEPGQYTLNVSVTDGKFTTPAAVHISVWGATQHDLEQGVTLKLAGMTPEEFIADHWRNLQRYLGNTLGVQRQGVHIASLQQEPNSLVLDVLLVLKQLDSPAAKAHLLTSMLPSSVQEIEELLGMQITNMKHGFCKGPSCPPAGCKSTVRMDAESVSTYATARISFITPQHVWEVVCSCNESAIRFSGNSYLQYQYLNTLKNNHLRLSLRLKTHQLQGMVMATNGTDTGTLEVINGELKFEYSCGRTPPKTLGVRNVTVSDGRWHRVLLEVNGTVLRLSLNKIHSTSITLAAPCRLLQSQGSLVFGGLIQAPPADRSWQVQVQRGFRGCLDALELNGEAINSTAKAGVQMPGERKVSGIYQCCSQSESCTSDPCRNGGTCQDTSTGEFLCSCAPQYFGSRCEIADNPCLSNPCLHGRQCVPSKFLCSCAPQYFGSRCEIADNPCLSNPCLHGRQCVPSSKGYLCNCPQPDTRNRCEDYVDVCHSSPCPSGFDCKTSNTTYHCTETLKIEISSDSQFGAREIIEVFAVVLGVLILVGVFVFSRKRYLRLKKHKPIDMHDPDSLFQPNVAKSMDWNDQELPPIEMNAMPETRNDLDQETALTLKARGQPDFTQGGGQTQKQRGTVVCSVAPNLPPRPPSSSDNESILKNNWELEYDGHAFVVSLAVADLVVAIYPYPLVLSAIFHDGWSMGYIHCQISGFLMGLSVIGSIFNITGIAINRYCYICHSLKYDKLFSNKNTVCYVILVWVLTILAIVPNWFVESLQYDPRVYSCTFAQSVSSLYTITVVVVHFILPISIVTYCYLRIWILVIQVRHRVKPDNRLKIKPHDIRNFLTMFVVFVLFAVCWAPLNFIGLAVAVNPGLGLAIPEWLFTASYFMAYFNSCLNAVVYGVLNHNFRKEYKRIIMSIIKLPC